MHHFSFFLFKEFFKTSIFFSFHFTSPIHQYFCKALYEWGNNHPSFTDFAVKRENHQSFFWYCSYCSLFLVPGSGMAEYLQYLPGANSANSNAG
jgi:hypothetical protein